MQVVIADAVNAALAKHPTARAAFARWNDVTTVAEWASIVDTRKTFPHADAVVAASGETVTVFNVGGNSFRLIAAIDYPSRFVAAIYLLTHAEYDKGKWKRTL